MRRQSSLTAAVALAFCLGTWFILPGLAEAASGREIKLPPLRVQIGETAPDFALPGVGGNTVRLSDFSGHNVLIDFYRGYW